MKKLYYCEDQEEFYWVTQTPKTIKIEWITKYNCDSEKTELDQNVRYKTLNIRKNKEKRHCLAQNNEEGILIYANQDGIPFYLEPATMTDITSNIATCVQWGISTKYYEDLNNNLA
jgi:hypothetical protein